MVATDLQKWIITQQFTARAIYFLNKVIYSNGC